MSDFITTITQRFETFTNSQKTVADYLLNHLNAVAFMTLEDLAMQIGVSTTTVIRFARALGYDGYSEMQKNIQADILNKVSLPARLNDVTKIPDDKLLKDSFAHDIHNIEQTLSTLSEESLRSAIESLNSARDIYILGMRSSFSLAHYTFTRIAQIKGNVRLLQSVGMVYPEEVASAGQGDVCIAFLFPRYSKTTATILSWMKNHGVKIILFTSKDHMSVNGYGDVLLPCAVGGISFKNSFAAPICLINYIAAALVSTDYENSKQLLERTEEILNQGCYLGL